MLHRTLLAATLITGTGLMTEAGPATPTLIVEVPDDCVCLASVVGNYTMVPAALHCGAMPTQPCVSFSYEKIDADSENVDGNCGLAGEPPCGVKKGCSYTPYYVTFQLASCVASCGVGPWQAYDDRGKTGPELDSGGQKHSIAVSPNSQDCDSGASDYSFEVRDAAGQVIGRNTLSTECGNCDRAPE